MTKEDEQVMAMFGSIGMFLDTELPKGYTYIVAALNPKGDPFMAGSDGNFDRVIQTLEATLEHCRKHRDRIVERIDYAKAMMAQEKAKEAGNAGN